jgi:rhodanese-related sulfurtransferase
MSDYRKISAVSLMAEYLNSVVLIDVRDSDEYKAQHIDGSVNIPLDELTADKATALAGDSAKVICLVCLKGMRSIKAGDKIVAELSNPLIVVDDGIETLPAGCLVYQ